MTKGEIDASLNNLYAEIIVSQNYLNDTDYKVLKAFEGVEAEDTEVKAKRQEARNSINEAQKKIEELNSTVPDEPNEILNN